MPRPALIIGVGGTGSWVLSWLKKDLLETYGSLEDQPVRLLLLDTADIIAKTGGAGVGNALNTAGINEGLGGYSRYNDLDPENEFIRLPTDPSVSQTRMINNLAKNKDESVDHISSWYAAGYFPDPALNLSEGAAKFRQLGRLSLIQGLQINRNNDPVCAGISNRIEQIQANAGGDRGSIDVHITGSFLGGSGSGIFIDIAWLVRRLVPNYRAFITGFFALPGAFDTNPTDEQRMKAFAAWRELNRMMTVKPDETEFRVTWGKERSVIHDVDKPVYDHVYLLDDSLGRPPKETTFPVMAEAISFFLDSRSGSEYVQHISTNLLNHKTRYPLRDNPPYSAIYVKSWKLPVFHNLTVAKHNFAREFLRRLLQIDETQDVNYADRRQVRTVYHLVSDPMYRNRASEMFNAPLLDTGSTRFIDDLAEVSRFASADYEGKVGGYAEDASGSLLYVYSEMPQTPDGIVVSAKISEPRDFLVRAIPDTNNTDDLHGYLVNTQESLYGKQMRGGKYIEYYGDFHGDRYKGRLFTDLEAVENFQVDVFKRRVQAWMRQELNRVSDQRFSGLACVLDALLQLDEDLKFCLRFYTDVKDELGSINEAQTSSAIWYGTAFGDSETGGLWKGVLNRLGSGPKAKTQSWKTWEDAHLNRQKSYRAVERILSTLRLMEDFVANVALANVRAMEQQLVTDNDFNHISGLYRGLMDSLEDENERHAFDQGLGQVMVLLNDDASSIPPVNEAKLEELLRRTKWTVDDRMNLRLEIAVSPNPGDKPIMLESSLRDPSQTRRLVSKLVQDVAGYVVFDDARQSSAADVLGIDHLNRGLRDASDPSKLLLRRVAQATTADVRTFYVRASIDQAQIQQVQGAIDGLPNLNRIAPNTATHVDSESKKKVVVFSARELLLPHEFGEWEKAKDAYHLQVLGDRGRQIAANFESVKNDHLFRGEQEALTLEHLYSRRDRNRAFPTLDQRLVHLLENRPRLEQFLNLWMFGFVVDEQHDDDDTGRQWRIQFPREAGVEDIPLANHGDIDMLGLMARYAAYGHDIGGNEIPFKEVEHVLKDLLKTSRRSADASLTLWQRYDFEARVAKGFAGIIEERINRTQNREVRPEAIKRDLDRALEDLNPQRPQSYITEGVGRGYRRALGEELAYDFTITRDGNPRVTNVTAHLQAMQVVLYLLYTIKGEDVQNLRQNNGWA